MSSLLDKAKQLKGTCERDIIKLDVIAEDIEKFIDDVIALLERLPKLDTRLSEGGGSCYEIQCQDLDFHFAGGAVPNVATESAPAGASVALPPASDEARERHAEAWEHHDNNPCGLCDDMAVEARERRNLAIAQMAASIYSGLPHDYPSEKQAQVSRSVIVAREILAEVEKG